MFLLVLAGWAFMFEKPVASISRSSYAPTMYRAQYAETVWTVLDCFMLIFHSVSWWISQRSFNILWFVEIAWTTLRIIAPNCHETRRNNSKQHYNISIYINPNITQPASSQEHSRRMNNCCVFPPEPCRRNGRHPEVFGASLSKPQHSCRSEWSWEGCTMPGLDIFIYPVDEVMMGSSQIHPIATASSIFLILFGGRFLHATD